MELTVASVVALVTLILGQITKKLGWVNKKYIPWQNFIIGVLSGLICWVVNLEPSLGISVLTCIIASYGAGGFYDNLTIGDENAED